MGNIFTVDSRTALDDIKNNRRYIRFGNGGTDVFLTVLGLSGSRLAKTEAEKKTVVWLLEHDQSCRGRGVVGFSLSEMPWTRELFDELKDFLLRVIDFTYEKAGWETLWYDPEGFVQSNMGAFRDLVLHLEPKDMEFVKGAQWDMAGLSEEEWLRFPIYTKYQMSPDEFRRFPVCQKHNMLLTVFGCLACNDEQTSLTDDNH